MAYVRVKKVRDKKTGKVYCYNQLVRCVWRNGKPRQEVLAHLGQHETVEEAIEALERTPVFREYRKHVREAKKLEETIRERYGEALKRHFDWGEEDTLPYIGSVGPLTPDYVEDFGLRKESYGDDLFKGGILALQDDCHDHEYKALDLSDRAKEIEERIQRLREA